MFYPETPTRIWLYTGPTDMRKSFVGLMALVAQKLGKDPLSGELFVFINRRKTHIKVLYFDGSGYCIWLKRLEQGQFNFDACATSSAALDWTQFRLFLAGIRVENFTNTSVILTINRATLIQYTAMQSNDSMAPTLPSDTSEEASRLRIENESLREQRDALQRRVAWFEKQLFGQKTEKRALVAPQEQGTLVFNCLGEPLPEAAPATQTVTYQRGTAKKVRPEDCLSDTGLRFSDTVPVEVITLTPPELRDEHADQYEIIDTKVSYKLAQRPASYVVLQYERPVFKKKGEATLHTTPMIPQVLDSSVADVSLLSGMLVDKFLYHLPLYRQHQRITQAGILLSRATLTQLVKRAIALLSPIADAQLRSVLQSRVLAMDETPIKAGQQGHGKMKSAWLWPMYGDQDEVVFIYSDSRGSRQIETVLARQFHGTLLSDGHRAYASYASRVEGVTHAQCWVHTRRYYIEAQSSAPEHVAYALDCIGKLYAIEQTIKEKNLSGEQKHQYRLTHSKPAVDHFFEWCEDQLDQSYLTPKHPLSAAIHYTLKRKNELSVFLEDPDVPLDTNHLERALRPIPMGRKNWLFCWTELGAEHLAIIQSLITTCKLHAINPYDYLTDVLQRVSIHPASQVEELTPRRWKETFANNPMRSILYAPRQ